MRNMDKPSGVVGTVSVKEGGTLESRAGDAEDAVRLDPVVLDDRGVSEWECELLDGNAVVEPVGCVEDVEELDEEEELEEFALSGSSPIR
jgi:hypothetical protein